MSKLSTSTTATPNDIISNSELAIKIQLIVAMRIIIVSQINDKLTNK